ncbi:MAG: peptidoglycan editing factor PgeF [Pseudomonadota bacterium]
MSEQASDRGVAPICADSLARSASAHDAQPIRHGFFTRGGGVSGGIYAGLNCGPGSNDRPENVSENRARVAAWMSAGANGSPAPISSVHQVHGSQVVSLVNPLAPAVARPKADGLVTATCGVPIGVLTADCGPVLFAEHAAGVIGACHAGWRGAVGGVLEATVEAMEALGAERARITAVLGPTISFANYEVGEAFAQPLLEADPDNAQYFGVPDGKARIHFDLPGYIVHRLRAFGIGAATSLDCCTYADPASFFSYRRATHRGEPDYGRQISAIVLR